MKYLVKFHGEPMRTVETLVDGFMFIRDEFKARWPRAIYGQQEAAAHGFTLVGVPELTPEEARDLRVGLREGNESYSLLGEIVRLQAQQRRDAANLGAALRPGVVQ